MSILTTDADPVYAQPRAERPAYATGMLLDAQDFSDEQTYHRGRLALAVGELLGEAILDIMREGRDRVAPHAAAAVTWLRRTARPPAGLELEERIRRAKPVLLVAIVDLGDVTLRRLRGGSRRRESVAPSFPAAAESTC